MYDRGAESRAFLSLYKLAALVADEDGNEDADADAAADDSVKGVK